MSSQTGYPRIHVSPNAISPAPSSAAFLISSTAFARLAALLRHTGAAWAIATRMIEDKFSVAVLPECSLALALERWAGTRSWKTPAFLDFNDKLTNVRRLPRLV